MALMCAKNRMYLVVFIFGKIQIGYNPHPVCKIMYNRVVQKVISTQVSLNETWVLNRVPMATRTLNILVVVVVVVVVVVGVLVGVLVVIVISVPLNSNPHTRGPAN